MQQTDCAPDDSLLLLGTGYMLKIYVDLYI